ANHLLLYGNYSKNILVNLGFNKDKIEVIYNSLDYDGQRYIRESIDKKNNVLRDYFNNNYPNIIYIGRIQKVKKIKLLIDAIYKLKESNINVNLILVGKDSEEV